jgi:hypothetical protein
MLAYPHRSGPSLPHLSQTETGADQTDASSTAHGEGESSCAGVRRHQLSWPMVSVTYVDSVGRLDAFGRLTDEISTVDNGHRLERIGAVWKVGEDYHLAGHISPIHAKDVRQQRPGLRFCPEGADLVCSLRIPHFVDNGHRCHLQIPYAPSLYH